MGRTLTEWTARVGDLLRDASFIDNPSAGIVAVGIRPALTQFSTDRPRIAAVDLTAVGRYLPFPAIGDGWDEGMSEVRSIEAPAGQTPPTVLADGEWTSTRDPSTPATARLLVPEAVAGGQCRVIFTAAWPVPTGDAAVDLLGSAAFDAVTSLAAALVLTSAAAEASRDRMGAMPTDFVDGTDRARNMIDAANAYRIAYNTFVGLGQNGTSANANTRRLNSSAVGSASKRLTIVDPYERWRLV